MRAERPHPPFRGRDPLASSRERAGDVLERAALGGDGEEDREVPAPIIRPAPSR
jgi:hypothetical protein